MFLDISGIKKVNFFEDTRIQSSNFKGQNLKSSPGSDMLVKILTLYPSLSAEWLLRGEGDMIRESQPNTQGDDNSSFYIQELNRKLDDKDRQIGDLREKVGLLKARIDQLEHEESAIIMAENRRLNAENERLHEEVNKLKNYRTIIRDNAYLFNRGVPQGAIVAEPDSKI